MSDIDRVFARLGGRHTGASDQRELRNIPGRGRSTASRVVEVVHLPSRGSPAGRDQPARPAFNVRAQSWEDGFPARSTTPPAPPPQPESEPAQPPTVHVMPMWEPAPNEPPAAPPPPAEVARRTARSPRPVADEASRRVADPFDAEDDGANCLRCGYLVDPARERRGLMTCAQCG